LPNVLVRIITLFEQERQAIALRPLVELHLIRRGKLVVCPHAVHKHIASQTRRTQSEVHMNVFGGAVVFPIVAVADVKRTVGIFVEHVATAWFVGPKVGVGCLAVPIYLLNAHVGMSHIQHFELAILVTCLENKLCIVRPT